MFHGESVPILSMLTDEEIPMLVRSLYSIEEAMQLLGGISRNTIYNLLRAGALPSVEFGRRRLISQKAIDEFVASRTTADMNSLLDSASYANTRSASPPAVAVVSDAHKRRAR